MTPQWITAICAVIGVVFGIPATCIHIYRICQIEKNTRKSDR